MKGVLVVAAWEMGVAPSLSQHHFGGYLHVQVTLQVKVLPPYLRFDPFYLSSSITVMKYNKCIILVNQW